jgi:hypothetical protein
VQVRAPNNFAQSGRKHLHSPTVDALMHVNKTRSAELFLPTVAQARHW